MQKTLGGDRLGSGNKQKIELHNYNRSTHDLSYIWRSTMAAGTLVPFMSQVALPGDTFDINLDCNIMTHPTIGPLFGSYKVQLDIFEAPIRLYQAKLHNNALGIGLNMSQIKLPFYTLQVDKYSGSATPGVLPQPIDNSQVNPSCLLAYLGVRGSGINNENVYKYRQFNAVPFLAYWDIYKNYYANKQEGIGAMLHTPITDLIQTVQAINSVSQDGNTSTLIPQLPTESSVIVDWSFVITHDDDTPPDPKQIMINTTVGTYTLYELCNGFIITSGISHLVCFLDRARWGTINVTNWNYRTNAQTAGILPEILTFPLDNIDDMRNEILASINNANAFEIPKQKPDGTDWTPYSPTINWTAQGYSHTLSVQEGLGLKTYQSDLFNNWLKTEWIDGPNGITAITAIDTSAGNFTIDTLNLSKKVYDMLNRIAVSGGSYNDWIDTVWQENKYTICTTPIYHGGLIKELIFQEVVSNSASSTLDAGDQPLGTLAGKGVLSHKHKGGNATIKVNEPSYIIGIISLTPRIDYSQGNNWDVNLKTLDDLHKPALDEIGFQELITDQMAWWDSVFNDPLDDHAIHFNSAGKQPAWLNYMTNVNRTYGNFAIEQNEMFMTLNRKYELSQELPGLRYIKDLTTYIDPSKYNNIFAQTKLDSQNFWAQIAVNITCRRLMSAKVMPNL